MNLDYRRPRPSEGKMSWHIIISTRRYRYLVEIFNTYWQGHLLKCLYRFCFNWKYARIIAGNGSALIKRQIIVCVTHRTELNKSLQLQCFYVILDIYVHNYFAYVFLHFLSFLILNIPQSTVEHFYHGNKDPLMIYSQYHDCSWPGAGAKSQGISRNGIDLTPPEYSDHSVSGVNDIFCTYRLGQWDVNSNGPGLYQGEQVLRAQPS